MGSDSADVGDVDCFFHYDDATIEWRVVDARLEEGINRPYQAVIRLRSTDSEPEPAELLGKDCILTFERIELANHYPGVIYEVEDNAEARDKEGSNVPWMDITVRMAPKAWLLSLNRQTRIFQDKTVEEILKEILEDKLELLEINLTERKDYPKYEYCVQYDESDLHFCERLMEREGLLYYFESEVKDPSEQITFKSGGDEWRQLTGMEKMVIIDNPHASIDVVSSEGATVYFTGGAGTRESIEAFSRSSSLRPTRLTLNHYDWTHPDVAIKNEADAEGERPEVDGAALGDLREVYQHGSEKVRFYDYDEANGYQGDDTDVQLKIRRELHQRDAVTLHGQGTVVGFTAGFGFALEKHPGLNGEYLLTRVSHTFSLKDVAGRYINDFECVPNAYAYRPDREKPEPKVLGLETATIVGPSDQEIYTDKHGRVKVQFHWDREGKQDEHSTCFIRVAQPWAGKGFGFVFLPRIGMEVTVGFVHGDPDRPIITGAVYNAQNPPPYTLPDDMTRSVVRTRSSKDAPAGHYNELSFEDKKGSEEVYLRAQRNRRTWVGGDSKVEIKGKERREIDTGSSESIKEGQFRAVDGGLFERVKGGPPAWLKGAEATHTVTRLIMPNGLSETIEGGVDRSVKGKKVNEFIYEGAERTIYAGGLTENITGNATRVVNRGVVREESANGPYEIKAKTGVKISSGTLAVQVEATTGDIYLRAPVGSIVIQSPKVVINGDDVLETGRVVTGYFHFDLKLYSGGKHRVGIIKTDHWASKIDNLKFSMIGGKAVKKKIDVEYGKFKVRKEMAKLSESLADVTNLKGKVIMLDQL